MLSQPLPIPLPARRTCATPSQPASAPVEAYWTDCSVTAQRMSLSAPPWLGLSKRAVKTHSGIGLPSSGARA